MLQAKPYLATGGALPVRRDQRGLLLRFAKRASPILSGSTEC